TQGNELKSLQMDQCRYVGVYLADSLREALPTTNRIQVEGEAVPALNKLFSACPRLEYLHIAGPPADAGNLKLPSQLVYLSLHESYPFISALLNEENCTALAPTLRALRLVHHDYQS